jgi:U3 small nucleolar RNA-associated protein 15
LEPILSFTTKFITKPRYSPVLIGVADKLCDIYSGVVGQSENIDEYFDKLRRHVKDECRTQKSLLRLIGQIDAVMCASQMQAEEDSD